MTFRRVLAQAVVGDLERAERWYTAVLDGPPDARPMDGLLQWNLGDSFGVQVWRDPGRAGHSGIVIEDSELDALAGRLTTAGIQHHDPEPGGGARVLILADPDGNQVVITGT